MRGVLKSARNTTTLQLRHLRTAYRTAFSLSLLTYKNEPSGDAVRGVIDAHDAQA